MKEKETKINCPESFKVGFSRGISIVPSLATNPEWSVLHEIFTFCRALITTASYDLT